MVLGPAPAGFVFSPKHKAASYAAPRGSGGRDAEGRNEQENG